MSKCLQDPLRLLQSVRLHMSEIGLFIGRNFGGEPRGRMGLEEKEEKEEAPANGACLYSKEIAVHDWSYVQSFDMGVSMYEIVGMQGLMLDKSRGCVYNSCRHIIFLCVLDKVEVHGTVH